eukprot:g10460.t1
MSGMQVSTFHGVKIYNLSSGKTLPQWLSEKKRRSLSKDVDYRRRIELLQDFDFPTASQKACVSKDGEYVIVAGTYPPQIKVFDVADLSMKFERHLDCEAVDFMTLADGYEKLAFLLADRTLAFHAGYGKHHAVRIPRFGRSLAYQKETCDMLVGCGEGEIHRFNLDQGRFRTPITLSSSKSSQGNPAAGINKIELCAAHQLLAAGTDDGFVHLWDSRQGQSGGGRAVASLDLRGSVGAAAVNAAEATLGGFQVSSVAFDTDGLTMGVGTSSAHCLTFDLRSSRPTFIKEHQYGLPITGVKFHQGTERRVLSSDLKTVKIWNRDDGAVLTNVETPADINDVCVAHDARGDSGLLLMATEQSRVLSYYVPALGPAPRWCSFLDVLTEELEEEQEASVYEDYKFVTTAEVEELGVSNLVGTPLLRGYMHGYFMDMKLYTRLKAVSEPFAYEEYRKKKVKEKMDEKAKSRISMRANLPKVNRAMAERLLDKAASGDKKRRKGKKPLDGGDEAGAEAAGASSGSVSSSNPLGDDRFGAMFESAAFEVDPESEEYARAHPTSLIANKMRQKTEDEAESEDEAIEDRFTAIKTTKGTARRRPLPGSDSDPDTASSSDGGFSSDEEELGRGGSDSDGPFAVRGSGGGSKQKGKSAPPKKKRGRDGKAVGGRAAPGFYELNDEEDAATAAVGLGSARDKQAQAQRRRERAVPLQERISEAERNEGAIVDDRVIRTNAGVVREFSYAPAAGSGRGRGKGRKAGRGEEEAERGGGARGGGKGPTLGKRLGGAAATGGTTAATVRGDHVDGGVRVEAGAGRGGARELNMAGFEKGSRDGREWRTCRAYREDKLARHKTKNQMGYDEHLRQTSPTPGAKWELAMTDDQDAEWLGLHNFDHRYEHGSEEADRRVKKLGYCRVHMPSIPRTGSTWFRAMFETATSQPSFAMWKEGGTFKQRYRAFSSDDPCGASLDHMEGNLHSTRKFPCRDVRPPNATSPILYKSHTPFFPSYNKPSLMPEETCMLVLLVRNPIDNHDAWQRYMFHQSILLREYLPIWQGHLSHWVASAGDIPIYVFRYEDMLLRAEEVLRRILQTLPGGWNWSEDSIAKAMRLFGPQRAFKDKCGAGIERLSVAEVEMVRKHYGSYMEHLGYRFVKK